MPPQQGITQHVAPNTGFQSSSPPAPIEVPEGIPQHVLRMNGRLLAPRTAGQFGVSTTLPGCPAGTTALVSMPPVIPSPDVPPPSLQTPSVPTSSVPATANVQRTPAVADMTGAGNSSQMANPPSNRAADLMTPSGANIAEQVTCILQAKRPGEPTRTIKRPPNHIPLFSPANAGALGKIGLKAKLNFHDAKKVILPEQRLSVLLQDNAKASFTTMTLRQAMEVCGMDAPQPGSLETLMERFGGNLATG
jgi:hypothetical protein